MTKFIKLKTVGTTHPEWVLLNTDTIREVSVARVREAATGWETRDRVVIRLRLIGSDSHVIYDVEPFDFDGGVLDTARSDASSTEILAWFHRALHDA